MTKISIASLNVIIAIIAIVCYHLSVSSVDRREGRIDQNNENSSANIMNSLRASHAMGSYALSHKNILTSSDYDRVTHDTLDNTEGQHSSLSINNSLTT